MKIPDLSGRADLVEEMDRLEGPQDQLFRTLDQFRCVNRLFSRYRSVLTHYVLRDMASAPERTYRLVDLGAGGCDIARWLILRSRKLGLRLTVLAIEHDPRVAGYARSASEGYPEIEVIETDALNSELWGGSDYIFANHLLHHLSNEACAELLRRLDASAPRLYILSDLIRSGWAYFGFWLAASPFFRNSFILPDGLASIRRGFTLSEVASLLESAQPMKPVAIHRLMPSRFLICGGHSDILQARIHPSVAQELSSPPQVETEWANRLETSLHLMLFWKAWM